MRRLIFAAAVAAGMAAASGAASAQDVHRLLEDYETTITVYGDRIPAQERLILDATAPVSVLTRQDLQATGATTIQEALQRLPSVFLHDQTGNPVETTVDVRGFPQGTSLAVFLDGVRMNDIQDNSVRWDVIPIEDVERIEVYRGATGPLFGGGALSAVVNIITRRDPGIPRLDLKAGAGSFGEREARVHASGTFGPWEFYASGTKRRATGWRENDGYDLDDGLARLAWSPDDSQTLALVAKYSGGAESDPGALTAAEMARDPRQSPYNLFDGTRGRERLASLTYSRRLKQGWEFSVQAYTRQSDRDTLTTGRFGSGFQTSGSESLSGAVGQARHIWAAGPWTWDVSAGAEASTGRFRGLGWTTDVEGGHMVPASSTATDVDAAGAYAQLDVGRGPLHLVAGARADQASYDYADRFQPAAGATRTFRETTWRAGLLLHTGEWSSGFLTYSEGYRIPSVLDLFAYPGYYSNPDLRPTRADDWEAGWRYLKDGWRFKATAFTMGLKDEVVFVLTDPALFIGQSQNVGGSRRRGLEAEAEAPLPGGFSVFAQGTYLEAEVTAGPYAGSRVPMVPRYQGTAGAQWLNPDWRVSLASSWVGPQRLDSDLTNTRPELPGYAVVSLSVRYVFRALTVEASASNLLDKRYAGRGITNGFTDYYTPAYPSGVRLSVMWSF